ncbi:hypothetical protein DEU32_11422 [Curtobacterium sp. AG1037]|uniref:hypothetical protein n=1 Tax=Curtobacterium sp. AG1037 TaxID=2183990 RepID=UPI000E2E2999|nr:hypothetical protein [Curtobacterium sp. AG1037]RDH95057.1 hypothetical protein DEU32_11422 [Curtobacterium sp. AG1037]
MADKECGFIDPLCNLGNGIEDFAQGQIADFVKSIAEGIVQVLKVVNSFWIYAPSPDVKSDAIATLNNNLAWYTYAFAVLGILVALIRMVMQQEFKGGMPGVKMLFNLIIVTGCYATGIAAMIKAGDAFAPWIIEKATGAPMDITSAMSVETIMASGIGPAFLLVILGFLGSIANLLFMLVRAVMLTILMVFFPPLAAASGTETGNQAWKKANGYLIAFLLFKPIAAVIFALGILQLKSPPKIEGMNDTGNALLGTSLGLMTLLMAALALPALIKFVVPVAANGSSMAFSGGAAAAAGVAAGAAVVTIGATAGAGAAVGAGAAGAGAMGGGGAAAAGGGGGAIAGGGTAAAGGGGSAATAGAAGGGGSGSTAGAGASGATGSGSGASGSGSTGSGAEGAGSAGSASSGSGSSDTGAAGAGSTSSSGSGGSDRRRADDIADVLQGLSAASGSAGGGIDDASKEN